MIKFEEREVSRDDALLWLNDWCGCQVLVVGRVREALIFEAEGELRHWTRSGADWGSRDDNIGRYCVGSAQASFRATDSTLPEQTFRVTDIGPSATATGEALTIDLGEHVQVIVSRLQSHGGED